MLHKLSIATISETLALLSLPKPTFVVAQNDQSPRFMEKHNGKELNESTHHGKTQTPLD